ncbi:MAG: hypothetical protein JNL79_05525 [Myxococcales bacterium]|nr:hypothetical protein [Myxococcales bacterium]
MNTHPARWALAVALAIGVASPPAVAETEKKIVAPAGPTVTKKVLSFGLAGVAFGQNLKDLTDAVGRLLDEDYKPLYAKVSPGVKMKQLDAALAEEKAAFTRSLVKYEGLTIDTGPLKGEHGHNTNEAKLLLTRKGTTHHFFLIHGKLWKVINEQRLGEKEPAGASFGDAVQKLTKDLGAGRARPADPTKGLPFAEVDWRDTTTHLRAMDRGPILALAYEELATLDNIVQLRAQKGFVK